MKFLSIDMEWVKKNFRKHILSAVRPTYMPADTVLFSYGSGGTAVYLLEEGSVQLTDAEGEVVAVLPRGAVFGQLAMLFDSPRQCTVTCVEDCKLWSMGRQQYLRLQRAVHNQTLSANARRLYDVLEVKALPNAYVERLMSTLSVEVVADGEHLLTSGKGNTKVAVIESGYVHLHFDNLLLRRSPDELLRALGIEVNLSECRGHCQGKWEIILSTPVFESEIAAYLEAQALAQGQGQDAEVESYPVDADSSTVENTRDPSPAPGSSPIPSRPGSALTGGMSPAMGMASNRKSLPPTRDSTPPPAGSSSAPSTTSQSSTPASSVRPSPVKPSALIGSTGKLFTRNARSISPAQLPPLDIPSTEYLRSAASALNLNPDDVSAPSHLDPALRTLKQ
jgi:CRP-like cAMP-binding protein